MYQVVLINFGIPKYQGSSLEEAKAAAKSYGFESVIYKDGLVHGTWSPISGYKGL